LVALTSLAAAVDARAEDAPAPRMPSLFSEQPLILGANVWSLTGAGDVAQVGIPGFNIAAASSYSLAAGAALGVADRLELDLAVPLILSPQVAAGNPVLGAIVRLLDGRMFELGASAFVALPVRSEDFARLTVATPFVLRPIPHLRIDVAPSLLMGWPSSELAIEGQVGLGATVDIGPAYAGITSGFGGPIAQGSRGSGYQRVPLGAQLGLMIPGQNGLLGTLGAQFSLPSFIATQGPEVFNGSLWTFGLVGRMYFYL
jgi:hypothetical protein